MLKSRILLVEDCQSIATTISLNLELSGYECLVKHDGLDAFNFIQSDCSFDLAILDVMLPGMDGFELLTHIRDYGIPVLFLTAKADVLSKVKGLRDGAEDYIVKPFEMLELLTRIEKILDRQGKLDRVLRFQDITIDTQTRTVKKQSETINLRPLEFELLVEVVRYKNCTLTRDRLLNDIWGIDFPGGTRTVDLHIARIRKKLCLQEQIVSISKVGYRLEE